MIYCQMTYLLNYYLKKRIKGMVTLDVQIDLLQEFVLVVFSRDLH